MEDKYTIHRLENKKLYGIDHPYKLNSYNRVKIHDLSRKIIEADLGKGFKIPNNSNFKIKNYGLNHYKIIYSSNLSRVYNLIDFHKLGFKILDMSDVLKETFQHHFK